MFQDENYYIDLESKVIQLALFIRNNVLIIAPNNMVSTNTINITVLLFFRVLMLSHQQSTTNDKREGWGGTLKQSAPHLHSRRHQPLVSLGSAGEEEPGHHTASQEASDSQHSSQPYWNCICAVSGEGRCRGGGALRGSCADCSRCRRGRWWETVDFGEDVRMLLEHTQ